MTKKKTLFSHNLGLYISTWKNFLWLSNRTLYLWKDLCTHLKMLCIIDGCGIIDTTKFELHASS